MTNAASQLAAPDRVLIVKPSSLGDVASALPVLRGLRRSFPQAHLAWLLADSCAPLVRHDSQLDEVILFPRKRLGRAWRSPAAMRELIAFLRRLRGARFDWVLDLQGLLRSGLFAAATRAPLRAGFADAREGATLFYTHRCAAGPIHTIDRNIALSQMLGIDARGEDLTLEVSPAGRAFAEEIERDGLRRGQFLVCVPPTRWPTKLYPVRHWRQVVAALARRMPIALLGSPAEAPLCAEVAEGLSGVANLAGRTGVEEMVGVIAASAAVVCSDSAAAFIAPAVGVQCVALIGPTQAARTGPYCRGRALVADVPCQGCLKRACAHTICMQTIGPAEVVAAVEGMLAR